MRTRIWLPLVLSLGLAGCPAPESAPTEIEDLSEYLFVHFMDEDPALLLEATDNLGAALLASSDLTGERAQRQWALPYLGLEALAATDGGIPMPEGEVPENQIPVAVAGLSSYPPSAHVDVQMLPDQTPVEPNSPNFYVRNFDPEPCLSADCEVVVTFNEVQKENLILSVYYEFYKDFRLLQLADGREVLLGRAWMPDRWVGEQGQNSIDQTYSVDVWLEHPDDPGQTIRYLAIWSAATVSINNDPDAQSAAVAFGIQQIFNRVDSFLDDQ